MLQFEIAGKSPTLGAKDDNDSGCARAMAFKFPQFDQMKPDFPFKGGPFKGGPFNRGSGGEPSWVDVLRWSGMTLSAAAVFLGLYAQSGMAFVPSLIIALCVALVMSAAHAMYTSAENAEQIGFHVQELKAAISTLSEDLNRVELAAMNFAGVEKLDQYVREFGRLNQDLRYISVTSEHLQDVTRLAAQLERLQALARAHQETTPQAPVVVDFGQVRGAQTNPDAGATEDELDARITEQMPTTAPDRAKSAGAETFRSNVTEIEQFRGLVDRIRRHTDGRRCDGSAAERAAFFADLNDAVEANRVDFLVQPVLSLPDRKPVMYQAAIELRDMEGCTLHFADCLSDEPGRDMVPALDDRIVYKSLQMVDRLKTGHHVRGVYCPVDAQSLTDDDFFAELLEAVGDASAHNGELVFEVLKDQLGENREVLSERLQVLAGRGFRFALSGGDALDMDLSWLRKLGFRHFKLDATLFQSGLSDEEGVIDEDELFLSLKEAELTPVFTGVDEKEMFDIVSRYDDVLAVGQAVAKPIRVEIEDFLDDDDAEEGESTLMESSRPELVLVEDIEPVASDEPESGSVTDGVSKKKPSADDDAA